ncbi:MAG: phosphate signaling complex protein PhoU [Coprothermobacterota bacterium]|nr:phosphate signaling complex protein PhoU [Coprothermobacterota bacterium]
MSASLRLILDKSIKDLEEMTLELGSQVRASLSSSLKALRERDKVLAQWVINNDDVLDDLAKRIDVKAVEVIATQQPTARDLRVIIAIIRMIADLERIGDLSAGVSKETLKIADLPLLKPLIDIPRMVAITNEMLEDALQSFILRDANRAEKMCQRDDEVDGLRNQIQRELLTYMLEDPKSIFRANALMFISLYLERAADHITNIGEDVIYMVTGEIRDLNG